jgi:transmembrane 9 superfamily protein 2/4
MFEGERWKTVAFLIALIFPGIVFIFYIVLNLIIVIFGSSSTIAVPFTTLLSIMGLWFGVSTPLVFLGAYFGFKKEPYKLPVKTARIPREIPNQVSINNL